MILPPTPDNIRKAAGLLLQGDLVAFPTETVYGLGADIANKNAIERIYKVKGRPQTNPLIIHLYSFNDIQKVASLEDSPLVEARLQKISGLWPGPLTVILPKHPLVSPLVTANQETVAVRIPNHHVALEFLKECMVPVAAPSANRSTYVSPTTAEHVLEDLGDDVDMILYGGPCKIGIESTIVSFVGDIPKILRPGAITFETLQALLPDIELAQKNEEVRAPGMSPLHYAPFTPIEFIRDADISTLPPRVGIIAFKDYEGLDAIPQCVKLATLSLNGNFSEISERLFGTLREFDKEKLDLILIDECPETGLGVAIMDRIRRALH